MRTFFLAILFITIVGAPTQRVARAQVSTAELARQLVGEGIEAARERNWVVARDRFARAYEIQPLPLTLYNLGTAQEKTGALVEADRSYRIFLRETSEGEHAEFRRTAARRRTALREKIAYVVVDAPNLVASDVLRVGDRELAHAVLGRAIPANPGSLQITVERGEEVVAEREVSLSEGSSRRVTVDVPLFVSKPAEEVAANAQPTSLAVSESVGKAEASSGGIFSSPWFWVGVGAVVVGAASVGAYFALRPEDSFESTLDPISL